MDFNFASPPYVDLLALAIPLSLITHQVFRRYETYAISVHAFLLFGPPTLLSTCIVSSTHSCSLLHVVILCYTTHLLFLATSVVVYRLSPLHPLSRYPGPVCCRLSMFWIATKAFTGKRHLYLHALHEHYGDIVRVGSNLLSIRDPSFIPTVMGPSGMPKGTNFIGGALSATDLPMIGIQDVKEHMRRRRPWNRALAPGALKDYESLIATRVRQFVKCLKEQRDEVVLGKWFNYFSYDLMYDMTFGGGSELMLNGDQHSIWTELDEATKMGTFFGHVPWLGVYVGHIPAVARVLHRILDHGRTSALERIMRGSASRDLFYYLNNEDLPDGIPPPTQHLADDGILAIIAGSDTSSSAMTSIWYCLLTHPEAYARLQDEVDKFYPPGEDACDPKHHRDMSYLTVIINETLRLFPPAVVGFPRQVPLDSTGVHIESTYLSPGTQIFLPQYSLHRDARNFSFPDTFWPERWLIAVGDLDIDLARARIPCLDTCAGSSSGHAACGGAFVHNEGAFIPFSHGPMNCPGKGLAMEELRVVTCAIVQRFVVRLREGWDAGEYERGFLDFSVASRPVLPVFLEERRR